MIVVSNTSPLTNLSAIGQFGLLHDLYEQVQIAEGVWARTECRWQALAWQRRGWRTSQGKPVLNQDLWQALAVQAEQHQINDNG